MDPRLVEMLECPACHGALAWNVTERRDSRIEEAEIHCDTCAAVYLVREGIGIFLTSDLPRHDLWKPLHDELIQHLREHPEVERQLMNAPLAALNPADQMYRALVSEERGDCAQAKIARDLANSRMYTPEYTRCWESQVNYVIEHVSGLDGPIVDLASGECRLVEMLARKLKRPIVATDFSPRVLRRDRKWLEFLRLYDQVSLLAFDARRTPFKDGAVQTLTTNLGLPNIEDPANLAQELRRIVNGTFWAITLFYPEDDQVNSAAISRAKLSMFLFRRSTLERLTSVGWKVQAVNSCKAKTRPTPRSNVLEGAAVDALPVAETTVEWCVLKAHSNTQNCL